MKAILKTKEGPGIEIRDVDLPRIGDTDILVKVGASSVCGSDVHLYEWKTNRKGPNWWDPTLKMPVILGHEFSGQVVGVGAGVKGVAVGDRITASPLMPCGECETCQGGKPEYCLNAVLGLNADGGMAEFVRLSSGAGIYRLPDAVSYEAGSLMEPLSVALHGVEHSDLKPGDSAGIFGPGPIGLLLLLILKASGASTVVMVGTGADKNRLALAKKLGAELAVNVEEKDALREIVKRTGGEGLDFVFEATGHSAAVSQALAVVKAYGKVILLGMFSDTASIDPNEIVATGKCLMGSMAYDAQTWRRSLALVSKGIVKPEAIIDRRLPLDEGKVGFELAAKKEAAKVIFTQ
jgi:threonine dehydrogenase-like Zn-dependent dehydrogenase